VIVLDSSFLIGFYNERDVHHVAASSLMDQFLAGKWEMGLLLEYVFLEVVTVLRMRRDPAVATRVGSILLDAKELEFVPCCDLFFETWNFFSNQTETGLSFIDTAIVQTARHRSTGRILTFDEEFRKLADLRINPA
jgi:uncharacterized protein